MASGTATSTTPNVQPRFPDKDKNVPTAFKLAELPTVGPLGSFVETLLDAWPLEYETVGGSSFSGSGISSEERDGT